MRAEIKNIDAAKNAQALRNLAGGFAVVMVLMVSLVIFGLMRLNDIYGTVKEIVTTKHDAIGSLYIMQGAARDRGLLVQQIARTHDAIEREESIQQFYEMGSVFAEARERWEEHLGSSDEGKQLVEKLREQTRMAAPLQNKVIDLVKSARLEEANNVLSHEALPAQLRVVQKVTEMLELELKESAEMADVAQSKHRQAIWFMTISGAMAIALSILITRVVMNRMSRLMSDLIRSTDDLRNTLRDLQFEKLALDEHGIVSIANAAGDIISVNQKFIDISGYGREELLGRNHRVLKSGFHPPSFYEDMWRTISEGRVWHGVTCNRAKNGTLYWMNSTIVPFLDAAGAPYQYVAIRTDISRIKEAEEVMQQSKEQLEVQVHERTKELGVINEQLQSEIERRKGLEEHLRSLAITDTLTGIYNRRKFDETLADEVRRSERYGAPLSLVLLDIDFFKKINDARGHQVGDTALKMLGSFIAEKIRSHDVLARYGGEEFVILTPGTGIEGCRKLAEKLRAGIEQHGFAGAGRITCSFGITEFQHGDTAESFVRRADVALYRAKKNGRNRTEEE